MYHVGSTEADKDEADKVFLQNMTLLIDYNKGMGWLKRLRLKAARQFFYAVQIYGSTFFHTGKSLLKELRVFVP